MKGGGLIRRPDPESRPHEDEARTLSHGNPVPHIIYGQNLQHLMVHWQLFRQTVSHLAALDFLIALLR